MLARPSVLTGLRRDLPSRSPSTHLPFRAHAPPTIPAFRCCFVCGFASLPNSCRRPRSGSPQTTSTRGRCFAAPQEPSWIASRAALVVPRHLSGLGLATPPGILQPDLGFEVHRVSFRQLPDNRDVETSGSRWDAGGVPPRVPHPSKTCSSPTAAAPHDAACLLAVHRSAAGPYEQAVRPGQPIRVPTSPPDDDADVSRPPTEVRSP